MALQMWITTWDTVVHSEAYITAIQGAVNYKSKAARIDVVAYHNAAAATSNATAIKQWNYNIQKDTQLNEAEEVIVPAFDDLFSTTKLDPAGMNPQKSVYEFIKTREEFAGAIDV